MKRRVRCSFFLAERQRILEDTRAIGCLPFNRNVSFIISFLYIRRTPRQHHRPFFSFLSFVCFSFTELLPGSFDEILIWLWAQKMGKLDWFTFSVLHNFLFSCFFFRCQGTSQWASLLIGYYIDFFFVFFRLLNKPSVVSSSFRRKTLRAFLPFFRMLAYFPENKAKFKRVNRLCHSRLDSSHLFSDNMWLIFFSRRETISGVNND